MLPLAYSSTYVQQDKAYLIDDDFICSAYYNPAIKIGFTGLRFGMTPPQKVAITRLEVFTTKVLEAHHEDYLGSDADFHHFIREIDQGIRIIIHLCIPANHPDDTTLRAFCKGDHTSEPKSFFARNRDIVDETDMLIATPAIKKETGETWYTINYNLT
jgi:hypothetical protein